MTTNSEFAMAALVAMAVTLVRLVEILLVKISKRKNGGSLPPKNPGGCRGLTAEEHAALIRLDDLHGRCDQDGTPLWYFPRSWAAILQNIVTTQHDITEKLSEMHGNQKSILKAIERLEQSTMRFDR